MTHRPADPPTLDPDRTPPRGEARPPSRATKFFSEGNAAWAGLALTLVLAIGGFWTHAVLINRDVEELKRTQAEHAKEVVDRRAANEARLTQLETRVSHAEDNANADRKYIELEFKTLTDSLNTIKADVADIKKQTK